MKIVLCLAVVCSWLIYGVDLTRAQSSVTNTPRSVVYVVFTPALDSIELKRELYVLEYSDVAYLTDLYSHLRELVVDSGVGCIGQELKLGDVSYNEVVVSKEAFWAQMDHGPFVPYPLTRLVLDGAGAVRLFGIEAADDSTTIRELVVDRQRITEEFELLRRAMSPTDANESTNYSPRETTPDVRSSANDLLDRIQRWQQRRHVDLALSQRRITRILAGLAAKSDCLNMAVVLSTTCDPKQFYDTYRRGKYSFKLNISRVNRR